MTPYVPKPQRGSSVSNGFFRKDEFHYDAESDAFLCPAGQVLSTRYESKLRELTKVDYSNRAACLVCAIKSRCTKDYTAWSCASSSQSPSSATASRIGSGIAFAIGVVGPDRCKLRASDVNRTGKRC